MERFRRGQGLDALQRFFPRQPRAIQQTVGLFQRRDRLARSAAAALPHQVQPVRRTVEFRDQEIWRNVLRHPRIGRHHRQPPHLGELMYSDAGREKRAIFNLRVTAQAGAGADGDVAAQLAIVRDVYAAHHIIVIDYSAQLRFKSEILRETLRRTAKLELDQDIQVHAAEPWNYRNRTRVRVQHDPAFALGYFETNSHKLLAVESCPISSPLINQAISAVWALGRALKIPATVHGMQFFANHDDTQLLIETYVRSQDAADS